MEISDGATRRPFRASGLLNKSQIKLASYIKQNKNVTLQGTKRFSDKSGEYYLKNIQLQNRQKAPGTSQRMSVALNKPQNLENVLNGGINKIKRKASKIVTLLPENALTPIPKKDTKDLGIADRFDKKELNDAQRTAVFIRRLEYATNTKRKMDADNKLKNQAKKIALIQEWWKTMYKIIKLQKNMRGFLFRKKLMNNLEHQEKLLQFITEFDNIHSYHLYKQFMDNLKKKRDYENSKLMEKCEDFNEKLDNLEKLHNYKNFKNCFKKWKDDTKKKKKDDYENLAKKLNDILKKKEDEDKKEALDNIKDKIKDDEEKLNDKINDFKEKNAKNKFLKDLIKAHRLNKMLNNIKNKLDESNKKDAFDKLKYDNNIAKGADELKKLLENKMKKDAFDDMKTMDFVDKLDDLMNKHKDKVNNDKKKDFMDNLKDLANKKKLEDAFKKWKDLNDENKNRNKILNKLIRHKLNEKRKKEEEEKNKLAISSGINDFELISDKKNENTNPKKDNQVFISSQNDINITAKPPPKLVVSQGTSQNFSLIPPEVLKFQFYEPFHKSDNLDKMKILNQLDDIDSFINDKLNKNKEKEDKFKKILNNLQKIKNNNNLREYFDRWRQAVKDEKINSLNNLAEKLNDILTKAKNASDDQLKKDALDELKKLNDIAKGGDKLDNVLNQKPKKDFLDKLKKNSDIAKGGDKLEELLKKKQKENTFNTLKKNAGMSEGFRILDKLLKNKLKKDSLDKLNKNADSQRALEDIEKLILDKYRKRLLDYLKKNNDLDKGMDSLRNYVKRNSRKSFLDGLKKRNKLLKGMENIEKVIKNNNKKNVYDELKKTNKRAIGANNLEKLINNKLRKKFLDKLKRNNNIQKAAENLNKFMENKLKKHGYDTLKKINNLHKGVEKLDKLIKNKKNKLKKDTLDKLKKNNAIAKGTEKADKILSNKLKRDAFDKMKENDDLGKAFEKIEKIINNNLKDDTFQKLKTMDFVHILQNMKKKHDDNVKNENLKNLMDNLKKIQNEKKEEDKNKLKNALDKLKDQIDRDKFLEKFKDLIKNKNLKNHFDNWKETADKRNILEKLKQYQKKENDDLLKKCYDHWKNLTDKKAVLRNTKKQKQLTNTIKNVEENKNNNDIKKYFDKWKDSVNKSYSKSKRISRRRSPKKNKSKSKRKINKNKKLLKDAFDKWRSLASFKPTRNVLQQIKKNKSLNDNLDNLNEDEKKDLYEKYKKKVLQVLSNIYKTNRNTILKKYFDKWKRATKPENKKFTEIFKYKKKPKILDKEDDNLENQDTNNEKNSFRPTYIISKQNLYNRRQISLFENTPNPLMNDKYHRNIYNTTNYKPEKPIMENKNYTTNKKSNLRYNKRFGPRVLDYEPSSQNMDDLNYDDIPKDREIQSLNNNMEGNYPNQYNSDKFEDEIQNGQFSDTSSNNDSLLSGITLIQNRKVIEQPRNYTSQSFFIDKNAISNFDKNKYQVGANKNNNTNNQLPMTMKGDFVSLIEQNPKILAQKNPRIQVTNATCDLNQIMNNENNEEDDLNDEEVNKEIEKLENNFIMDKNKVLNKVIQNCDKDLYATQKPFQSKKDQWYSVSIPLNDNEAKWEFLNNIKGERDKNNLNKFELIQKEIEHNKKEEKPEEPYSNRTFKPASTEKRQKRNIKDNSYKLQEMNFSQFYRSPNRPRKIYDEEKLEKGDTIIKRPGKRKILHGSQSTLGITRTGDKNLFHIKNQSMNTSKGNIKYPSRNKTIEHDYDSDEYNDYTDE